VPIIIGLQIIFSELGARALNVNSRGASSAQWGISVAFGFGEWVVGFLQKFIPEKLFKEAGLGEREPPKPSVKKVENEESSPLRMIPIDGFDSRMLSPKHETRSELMRKGTQL